MAVYTKSNSIPLNCSISHTITATDVTDEYVELDFGNSWDITGTVMCVSSTGVVIDMNLAVVTFPSAGKVRVAIGTNIVVFVAGNKLLFSLNRDNSQFTE